MNNQDLSKYRNQLCWIIMEKRSKHENTYKYVFGTVEIVNERCLHVVDTKGSWIKIPIESLSGIQMNGVIPILMEWVTMPIWMMMMMVC